MKYYIIYSTTEIPSIKVTPTAQLAQAMVVDYIKSYPNVGWGFILAPVGIYYHCRIAMDFQCQVYSETEVLFALDRVRKYIVEEHLNKQKQEEQNGIR